MIGGVVQGTITPPYSGQRPIAIEAYSMTPQIIGVTMNGAAMMGLSTSGTPKMIGSLTLKIDGTAASLPRSRSRRDLAKKSMKITKPMVTPDPLMTMAWSRNCLVTICPPLATVSARPASKIAWFSAALASSMGPMTPSPMMVEPWMPKIQKNGIMIPMATTPPNESVSPCSGMDR